MKLISMFRYAIYLVVAVGFVSAKAGAYEDWFSAIETDNAGAVTRLMQAGFDPNTRNPQGQVGLYLALQTGGPRVADALWAHPGLEVDAANAQGETPLMMAALKGRLEWTQRLLERGARLNREGWTPLHYAASGPEPKVVELLLARGAALEARSPNGSTPLMLAARYGSEASVDLLLARGADPKLRNQRDLTAADFARMDGRDGLAKRLESATALRR
jgi:ankyrin repeat protein